MFRQPGHPEMLWEVLRHEGPAAPASVIDRAADADRIVCHRRMGDGGIFWVFQRRSAGQTGRGWCMFQNREAAGRLLAARLGDYRDDPVAMILALPRGGVAVGYPMSKTLHLPLDVFVTRKIGAPGNPEYAIGALSETGFLHLNEEALSSFSLSRHDLESSVQALQEDIEARLRRFRPGRPSPDVSGRTVILVDDGIATGSTFLASIHAIRALNPKRLVGAIPVGPRDTLATVANQVDELVVLSVPDPFYAVGHFYADFTQVEDRDVIRYLTLAEESRQAGQSSLPDE